MADTNGELPANLRYLGNQFQLWRVDAGVRREAAAEAVGYSVETVKSVEYGRRKCPPKMALIGDELFGAKGKLKAGLQYQEPEKYAPQAQDFIPVEQQASWLWTYESTLMPGLLQTERHARSLMEDHCPPFDDETVEQRLTARMDRQKLLSPDAKPLVEYSCVLAEAVLRVPVGGRDTHREQLQHLLKVGGQRNVSVQVLPFECVTEAAMLGPMVIVETREQELYGYMEVHMASSLTSDPRDTNTLMRRYGMIRMQALSVEESARFIERTVAEL
ncbi:helix-turn-helix transcriptional regulator [Streptomyces sp. HNM0574]|uniref:helix-turn-helix domain-containing protein n=1 Tax=Streptomyces sp. HNM0574 TaxID=2714954 RepID=UPI00146C9BA3|nr:helix-turn-helix transcriptional regulator [Streptomyces sp. HNM0574]NLU69576.1 helix-turn-helix domain-containing protein [Streptomyces sp. HNM0574]